MDHMKKEIAAWGVDLLFQIAKKIAIGKFQTHKKRKFTTWSRHTHPRFPWRYFGFQIAKIIAIGKF
jgi:hypothetical protein